MPSGRMYMSPSFSLWSIIFVFINKWDRISFKELAVFSWVQSVSSIYIWSKNFSHSVNVKSEAIDGGH